MPKVTIKTKVEIAPIEVFVHDNQFVTHNCARGAWWGNSMCEKISIDDELADIAKKLPDGKYKIQILVTQISDNGWDI